MHLTQRFSTTFFNKTADLVEKPAWVDFELLGLYLGFAAALAGLGAPPSLHLSRGRESAAPVSSRQASFTIVTLTACSIVVAHGGHRRAA